MVAKPGPGRSMPGSGAAPRALALLRHRMASCSISSPWVQPCGHARSVDEAGFVVVCAHDLQLNQESVELMLNSQDLNVGFFCCACMWLKCAFIELDFKEWMSTFGRLAHLQLGMAEL